MIFRISDKGVDELLLLCHIFLVLEEFELEFTGQIGRGNISCAGNVRRSGDLGSLEL